jgi:hypothetical protein
MAKKGDLGPCACGRFKLIPANVPMLTDGTVHLPAMVPEAICEVTSLKRQVLALTAERDVAIRNERAMAVEIHRLLTEQEKLKVLADRNRPPS